MEKRPLHCVLVAAKSDLLSEHMKSGSFICVILSHVKQEVKIKAEKVFIQLQPTKKTLSVLELINHFDVKYVIKDLHRKAP